MKRNFPQGGTPGNSWWGCAARFFKSWPDLSPKTVLFHNRFQTWPLGRNYLITTQISRQIKKKLFNLFRIRIFLFLSYSFGIEKVNTFIHSRSSHENHTRFHTKTAQFDFQQRAWGYFAFKRLVQCSDDSQTTRLNQQIHTKKHRNTSKVSQSFVYFMEK